MKKNSLLLLAFVMICSISIAQKNKKIVVPAAARSAFEKKYPEATNVLWEKEKSIYEANWGGTSGEDHSAQFTPSGKFVEIIDAIAISDLPKSVSAYVATHYKSAKITEAGKVTDASGKQTYEAEVNGKDLIFDVNGKFLKKE